MYAGISGQYNPQEHHMKFARVQYVPCDEWEKEKPLKPLWPTYLSAAVIFTVFVLILIGGI